MLKNVFQRDLKFKNILLMRKCQDSLAPVSFFPFSLIFSILSLFFSFMIHIFLIFVLSKIIVFPFFSLIEKQHPTLTNLVAILATLVIILMMLVTILAIQMTILDQA